MANLNRPRRNPRLNRPVVLPSIYRHVSDISEAPLEASGSTGSVVLLTSKSRHPQLRRVRLAGRGRLQVFAYDRDGVRSRSASVRGNQVVIEPGGFTLVFRPAG